MLQNNPAARRQVGDTFKFAPDLAGGTREVSSTGEFDPSATFVVVRAESTYGGDKFGLESRNGPWKVWAAPKGTRLEDLSFTMIVFYQPDEGHNSGLNRVLRLDRNHSLRSNGDQANQIGGSGDGRRT